MFPSELAKPQSYLGVPWFCLECIGLMLSSVGLQWCSGHGALVFSCRPSIALSSCSPGETRTNINYVGSRMVSICMYILYRYLCYTVHSPNISPWPHKTVHRELSNIFIQFSIQSFYSCSQTCHLPLATATATCPQSCHGNLKDFSFPLFRFDFNGVGPDACLANSSMSNQCKVLGCSFPFQRYATNTCSAWISSAGFNFDRVITVILMSSLTDL